MKEFHVSKGTHIRSNNKTSRMMFHLLIALIPIIIFAWYKNGLQPFLNGDATFYGMIFPLLFVGVSTLTTFIVELLYGILFKKKRGIDILKYPIETYSFFPGLFLGLILPINTSFPILILGAMFATIVGKLVFGGFGHNIFNPALLGRLFVIATYGIVIGEVGGYLNPSELDAVTTATPLTNASLVNGIGTYQTLVEPYGSLWNFFFGTIPGAVGETSAFLCILAFLYLTFQKVIKWKIPVVYILTVFFMTFLIGNYHDLGIWYPLFEILSGGLMFGAVFMATDPVTSPTTPVGQILYGLFLGILTVVFRYLTPLPEGVLTSILTMNLFVFILDRIGSKARFNFVKSVIPFLIAWVLILGLGVWIGSSHSLPEEGTDPNYTIESKQVDGDTVTYIVTEKGYVGPIRAQIILEHGTIRSIEVLSQSESFYSRIESADYIDRLIENQNNLEEYDTVSGATVTSTALKKMVINTLNDYQVNGKEEVEGEEETVEPDFEVLEKTSSGTTTTYIVTQKSFGGKTRAEIVFEEGQVSSIEILEAPDTYQNTVIDAGYLEELINASDLDDVDAVSGATITSGAWKEMLASTIEDYEGGADEE